MKNIDEEYFKKVVANKIKKSRKISQADLAEKAEVSVDTVSSIERGKSVITSLTLVKLCNALNISPDCILEDFLEVDIMKSKLEMEIATLSMKEKKFLLYIIEYIKQNRE